jgi:hypothetical protein
VINGVVQVTYASGELQVADGISGQWINTGNTSRLFAEATVTSNIFYRVRGPQDALHVKVELSCPYAIRRMNNEDETDGSRRRDGDRPRARNNECGSYCS